MPAQIGIGLFILPLSDIQKENFLYRSPYGTSHGSPYDYDTHVPLIFSHKNYEKHKNSVNSIAFAPHEYGLILLCGSSDGSFSLHEYKSIPYS